MKKRIIAILLVILSVAMLFTGCREAERVQYNMAKDADYFGTERKITVYNAISNTVIMEIEGYMSISNTEGEDELVVICKTGANTYKRNLVYLGTATLYVVEDIDGTHSDPYHYHVDIHIGNPISFDVKH